MNWISPNEQWLLIYRSFSSLLNLYRLPHLEPVVTLTNHGGIGGFAFSPHGDELAVSSSQRVEFWNTRTWQRTRELTNFMGIIYSPDGRTMWLTRDYRDSGLYDASTLKLLLPLPTGAFPLALSPDGRSLAVSVNLRRLQVWDLEEVRRQLRDVGLDWEQP
jgi:WD40 repeat protein